MAQPLIYQRYRRQTVVALCRALHKVWVLLLQKAHSPQIPLRAKIKLALADGTCRLMLTIVGDPGKKFPGEDDALLEMLLMLEQDSTLARILHIDVLFMIQVLHDRMDACRREAIRCYASAEGNAKADELLAESQGWWRAYDVLRNCCGMLQNSGFLAEIPNTSEIPPRQKERLETYLARVQERWEVIGRALGGSKLDGYSKGLLQRVVGLGIFRGLRTEARGKAPSGIDGQLEYHLDAGPRARRSWYATLAEDLSELEELARSLKGSLFRTSDPGRLASIRSTLRIVEITIENLLRARPFAHVPL